MDLHEPSTYQQAWKRFVRQTDLSCIYGKIIKAAAKRAGIKKNVYSYLCRHSQGTRLYGTIGGELAKKQMLHAPDSKMARVYCHLSSEDLLHGLRKANGIEINEEKECNNVCWRCHHPNSFGSSICSRCSSPLSIKAVVEKKEEETEREALHGRLERLATLIEHSPKILKVWRKSCRSLQTKINIYCEVNTRPLA